MAKTHNASHDPGEDLLPLGLVKAACFPRDRDLASLRRREPVRQNMLQAQELQAAGQLEACAQLPSACQGPPDAQRLQAAQVSQAPGQAPAQAAEALSAASMLRGGELLGGQPVGWSHAQSRANPIVAEPYA